VKPRSDLPPPPAALPPRPYIPPRPYVPPRPYIPPRPAALPPGSGANDEAADPRSPLRRRFEASLAAFGAGPLPRLLVLPALAAIGTMIAAAPWARALNAPHTTLLLALAAVAPVLIAVVVAGVARLPTAFSYAASFVGLVVFVVVGVTSNLDALRTMLTHEPTELLTETLPIAGGKVLLLVPILVVWITGAATAEILVRSRRSVAAPAVPVLSYLVAFAATAGAPGRDGWTGPALLAAVILLALARTAATAAGTTIAARQPAVSVSGVPAAVRSTGSGRLRRTLLGAALAAVVVIGLAYGVPRVAAVNGTPDSLARSPAVISNQVVDPVDAIAALRDTSPKAPATTLLSLTTSASTAGYFGLATLDDYNGDTWGFDTTFEPTGGRVPLALPGAPGGAVADTTPVRQTYRLSHGYGLPFIPMLDRASLVSGLPVDIDAKTGMVVPAETLRFPTTYSVESDASDLNLSEVPSQDALASGSTANAATADLQLPAGTSSDLTAATQFAATLTGQQPAATIAFLQDLISSLQRDEKWVDPSVSSSSKQASATRGGTSLAEVINAITIARRATPEQFATFFALVARDLGMPARIVTGFRVPLAASHPNVAAGTYTLTNRDAWTWAEIPVEGLGWVVANPTPTATASSVAELPTKAATTPTTIAPRQANAVPASTQPRTQAVAPPVRIPTAHSSRRPVWLTALEIAALAILALLLLGPGLAGARRLLKRRHRRRGSAPERAAGAWLELLDNLDLAGVPIPAIATSSDVAGEVAARYGPELGSPVALVGATAERAVYSVADPPDEEAATRVWAAQRSLRREVRSRTSRSTRLRSLIRVGHQPRRPARSVPGESS
jgi:TgpA N-terminal domain/Transglutaminase-like superfamily